MFHRKLENRIVEDLDAFRILNIQGSRQSGKTTMVKELSKKQNFKYYTFDNNEDIKFAMSMPNKFVRQANEITIVLDEIQKVPQILPHLKMQVDNNNRPGQFILTGSADLLKMKKVTESLAGRRIDYELMTLSIAEINNLDTNIIDALISGEISEKNSHLDENNDRFFELAIKGGYPEVQNFTDRQRKNWYKSYVNSRITKDVEDIAIGGLHKKNLLFKMLKYLSWQAGDLLNYSSVSKKLSIDVKTVKNYTEFFDTLFLSKNLMPYYINIGKRQIKTAKYYFSDSGLLSYLLNVEKLPDKKFTGKIIENFIYCELLKNNTTAENPVEMYFYRDKSQYEVDIILESNFDELIAIEIKSKEYLKSEDFRGIRKLKRLLGDKLIKAYVFYAGKLIYPQKTEEGIDIIALPFNVLFEN